MFANFLLDNHDWRTPRAARGFYKTFLERPVHHFVDNSLHGWILRPVALLNGVGISQTYLMFYYWCRALDAFEFLTFLFEESGDTLGFLGCGCLYVRWSRPGRIHVKL